MRRIGWALGMLLGTAGLGGLVSGPAQGAVTWTCKTKMETIVLNTYLVASECTASGTYTTGGDAIAGGALCASGARKPQAVVLSNANFAGGGPQFVANYDPFVGNIQLATASATPGAGSPLTDVTAGTNVGSYTLRAIAFCQ